MILDTSQRAVFEPLIAVDEWFHAGHPSQIVAMSLTRGDTATTEMKHEIGGAGIIAAARLPTAELKPDEAVTLICEAQETRHVNDAFFQNMIRPTVRPRVTVNAPVGFEWEVMFGFSRGSGTTQSLGRAVREMPGMLLPGQVIQVRWWKQQADEKPDPPQPTRTDGPTSAD